MVAPCEGPLLDDESLLTDGVLPLPVPGFPEPVLSVVEGVEVEEPEGLSPGC